MQMRRRTQWELLLHTRGSGGRSHLEPIIDQAPLPKEEKAQETVINDNADVINKLSISCNVSGSHDVAMDHMDLHDEKEAQESIVKGNANSVQESLVSGNVTDSRDVESIQLSDSDSRVRI